MKPPRDRGGPWPPPHRRSVRVVDVEIRDETGQGFVTVAGPFQAPVSFPVRDHGHAVCMVDLIKQGAFSLPINPRS